MILIPIPLPEKVIQTSSCTILLYNMFYKTVLGMGMGMNVTAQTWLLPRVAMTWNARLVLG